MDRNGKLPREQFLSPYKSAPIISLFPCLRNVRGAWISAARLSSGWQTSSHGSIPSPPPSPSILPRWCHNAICHRGIDRNRVEWRGDRRSAEHSPSPSWNAYPRERRTSQRHQPACVCRPTGGRIDERGTREEEREREYHPPSSRSRPRKINDRRNEYSSPEPDS